MNFENIGKKLWARITESRWTIAYISFAVLQLIISVAVEAVILQKNEVSYGKIQKYADTYDSYERVFAYKNYTYNKYGMQFQSITHGNIWFMIFEAFLTALCFSAVFFQNTIEVISVILINISLVFLAGTQIIQSNKWISRVNSQIELDNVGPNSDLSKTVVLWEVIQLLFSMIFITVLVFLGYKLYKQFGWNIYKEIGANIQMQRMYRTYLVLVLLLKLDLFLLMGFQILNLVFLFNDTEDQRQTIILQSIMVASVIPMVGLALWGVRREIKVAMFIFAVASVITIGNFLYILAKFIIDRDEYLLTILDILGILLTMMSMVVAYLAVRNFDRGLKDHFQKRDDDAVNLEARGQGQRKRRFSIDD